MRLTLITILICITTIAFGQFKLNSVGVCYLQKETTDDYFLTIVLPYQTLDLDSPLLGAEHKQAIDTLIYQGKIILLDSVGEVCRIENTNKFLIQFWCENDGGTQNRPTLSITIKKNKFKRQLKGIHEIQSICCFVLLNQKKSKSEEPDFNISGDIKLKCDYNQDGKPDCFIWTFFDDAENCSGEPKNHLGIMLQVGKQHYSLRCCGP